MDASSFFKGKKITVMGLGLLGRGVGDVRFLIQQGAEVIVTDLKSEEDLAPSLEALKDLGGITYHLGAHHLEDFSGRDLILKAPKTPQDSIYIKEALRNGIPVTMSTALFARFAREAGATLVGITGTRGKTTTTEMIAHILRVAGKQVLLGGNIRGVSTLALLPEVTKETLAVLELDSWQLQGFGAERLSPDVAVFTTFYPDHMDYYQGDMQKYLADKAEIFLHQRSGDTLVLGQAAEEVIPAYPALPVGPITVTAHDAEDLTLSTPGIHNLANAACARAAARALGVSEETIREALESFKGVAGRLEFVREVNGVLYYNDTTATTPEATIAALRALSEGGRRVILIMGGYDKGLSMHELIEELPRRTKRTIFLAGTGTDRIMPFLHDASVFGDLKAAFDEAVRYASPGDVVVLSPAFASFGMFKNEYERGDQYLELVRALT
ncbi:MAG: UDP-N-acetylmuramoyl-L-alanine--D-glutamate ligase [Patescibacteria group bacterium]